MANEIIGRGDIAIGADLSAFEKAMDTVPKKAGKANQDAAKSVGSAWAAAAKSVAQNQLISNLETIAALGIQVGGDVSRLSSAVTSLIRPLAIVTEVLGPMGVGLVAVGGGAIAAAAGTRILADAAVEAEGRLDKLGVKVEEDERGPLRDYRQATHLLGIEMDALSVEIGGKAAPAVTRLSEFAAAAARDLRATVDATGDWQEATEGGRRAIVALASVGTSELIPMAMDWYIQHAPAAADATDTWRKAIEKLEEATKKAAGENMEATARQDEIEGARQNAMALERERQARLAGAEATRKQKEALDDMLATARGVSAQAKIDEGLLSEDALRAWNRGWLETEAAIANVNREMEEMAKSGERAIKNIDQGTAAWEEHRQAVLDVLSAVGEYSSMVTGAVTTVLRTVADATIDWASEAADALDRLRDRERELYSELADLRVQQKEEQRDNMKERIQLDIDATQAEIDQLNIKEAARRKIARNAADDARRAFMAERRAAISEIELNGLIATIAAFAMLGPIAGAIAAGAIQAATQAAAFEAASVPIPEFPTGMSPDHFPIAVQRGEPVLSRAANHRLEDALGPGAADRLNHGMSGGGRVTYLQVGRRVVAAMLEEAGVVRQVDPRAIGKRGRRR